MKLQLYKTINSYLQLEITLVSGCTFSCSWIEIRPPIQLLGDIEWLLLVGTTIINSLGLKPVEIQLSIRIPCSTSNSAAIQLTDGIRQALHLGYGLYKHIYKVIYSLL